MATCPIKSLDAWKLLVSSRGEDIAHYLWDKYDGNVPELESKSEIVKSGLKATSLLQSPKADQFFNAVAKNKIVGDFFWKKMQTDLGIPKDQLEILKSFDTQDKEELISSLLANYSYAVEINTAKTEVDTIELFSDTQYVGNDKYWISEEGKYMKKNAFSSDEIVISKKEYENAISPSSPSQYYSNLTVPGGTNYTENEIATPAITPNIKGHAQFATDQGIGWFRSDEQGYQVANPNPTSSKTEEVVSDGKTRRILEVQSDLFQKGRDKALLIFDIGKKVLETKFGKGITSIKLGQKFKIKDIWFEISGTGKNSNLKIANQSNGVFIYNSDKSVFQNDAMLQVTNLSNGKVNDVSLGKIKEYLRDNVSTEEVNKSSNKFLQILNKDNNWVTFFVKSIIQDSAKKGYEKVLFPTGNTASKVEGHTTLEEFKKQKLDRIKELEKEITDLDIDSDFKNKYLKEQKSYGNTGEFAINLRKERNTKEINQLKQELERVEGPEGFGALKPIYNFYENTVTNILNKQYGKENVKQVTDEYGNTWNEINIVPEREQQSIFLQKSTATSKKASPKLISLMKDFISRIGVDYKSVSDIVVDGKKVDANGVALIMQKLIQVVDGKEAQALPEEAMHFAVSIIKQTNPKLYKKLLSEINNYTIKNKVFAEYNTNPNYQTADGKPDVIKLKEEAIAQLLVEIIINKSENITEKPELIVNAVSLWDQIVEYLKGLFSTSGFDKFSNDILSGKNIGSAEDIKDDGAFFQLASNKQEQVFNSIKETSNIIKKDDQGYTVDGKRTRRVSDIVSDWYERRFKNQDLNKSEYEIAVNDLKAEKGTAGHNALEYAFDLFVDEKGFLRETPLDDLDYEAKNPNFDKEMYNILKKNLRERLNSFPEGTRFMSEATIYDPKRNLAGTVDFLAITPEGNVNILDWKFMDLNIDKYADIPWYKVNAWNTQMDQYKSIISSNYGVKNENFGQTRMIPIKAFYSKGNPKTNVLPKLTSIKIGAVNVKNITEDYLLPVGIQSEKTGVKKIDELLKKLNASYKKLSEQKVSQEERANKAQQLNELFTAIRQLQIKQNIEPLLHQAKVLNKSIEILINKYNTVFKGQDPNSFTDNIKSEFAGSIRIALEVLETYVNLDKDFRFLFVGELSEEDKLLKEDLRKTVDDSSEYKDFLTAIDEDFAVKFSDASLDAEKVVKGVTKWFSSAATLQVKNIQTLFKKANKAFALAGMDTLTETKKLSQLKDAYQKWAASKGLNIKNQFDILKKKNTNELIDEYKKEFYSSLKKHIEEKDIKWIKENIDVEAYKEYLEEVKKQEIARVLDRPRVKTTEENVRDIKRELEKVKDLYDVSTPTSVGWLLYDKINKFPKRETWESTEWKELHAKNSAGEYINKPALDFFNYIRERNEYYRSIGYINAKQARTFLPWVRKGVIEKMVFGGKLALGEQFLRNISVDEADYGMGQIDPLTGKVIDTIPIYFTKEIEGEASTDLFKTMALYNEYAIKFKYLSDIEEQSLQLLRVEKNKNSIATSKYGKTIYEDGVLITNEQNIENSELLESMIKAIVYQQKYLENESFDQLLGKVGNFGKILNSKLGVSVFPENLSERQLSINKVISQLNNTFQVATLGLNVLSSMSNLFGGKTQSLINAGKYFTKSDFVSTEMWLLANKMGGSDKQKALAALDYFIPFVENYNRDAPRQLSLNKLDDQAIQDYLMIMMREGEKSVQVTNFFSFLKNSVVVDGKVLNAREYLKSTPEYENFYKGTEAERNTRSEKFEQDVKELVEKQGVLETSTVVDGELVIPGVDRKSESVIELRRKVQQFTSDALGSLSEENKRLINLNIYSSSFMVFKNWIPRLVDVRMGNLKYNAASDAYEWGRSRMIMRIISEDVLGSIGNLSNALQGNDKGINFVRELYEKKKSDYERDTGKTLEMTEDEFIELTKQNIKNQILDLMVYATLFALTLAFKALAPDDDEDPIVKNQYKFLLKATDKFKDELGYFYNPTSLTDLVSKGIFPAMGLLENYKKVLTNFLIENYALATGDDETLEKNQVIKYLMKSFPISSQAAGLLPMFYPEVAKDLGIKMQGQYGIR
jgi:hypothetical protein